MSKIKMTRENATKLTELSEAETSRLLPEAEGLLEQEEDLLYEVKAASRHYRDLVERCDSPRPPTLQEFGRVSAKLMAAKVALYRNYVELMKLGWYETMARTVSDPDLQAQAADTRPPRTGVPGVGSNR
jgi:hypothetical protein